MDIDDRHHFNFRANQQQGKKLIFSSKNSIVTTIRCSYFPTTVQFKHPLVGCNLKQFHIHENVYFQITRYSLLSYTVTYMLSLIIKV